MLLLLFLDGNDDEFFELSGVEEAPYVHAVLAFIHPATAYKEGN